MLDVGVPFPFLATCICATRTPLMLQPDWSAIVPPLHGQNGTKGCSYLDIASNREL